MKIICVGQASYDVTYCVEEYPEENTKVRVSHVVKCGGGSASNAAYLLGKWGADTSFIGTLGDDCYGHEMIREFEEVNVDVSLIETNKQLETPSSIIVNNLTTGSRTILTYRERQLKYRKSLENIKANIILMDTREPEAAVKLIKKNKDAIKVLDAGTFNEITCFLGEHVDYLVTSKNFAEDYTNVKIDIEDPLTIRKVYEILEKKYKNKIVITLEDAGCLYKEDGVIKLMPTLKMKAKDTTGAGDIYHGAFVYALSKGYKISDIVKIANIAGALSVRKIGGRNSVPSLDEVMNIFEQVK